MDRPQAGGDDGSRMDCEIVLDEVFGPDNVLSPDERRLGRNTAAEEGGDSEFGMHSARSTETGMSLTSAGGLAAGSGRGGSRPMGAGVNPTAAVDTMVDDFFAKPGDGSSASMSRKLQPSDSLADGLFFRPSSSDMAGSFDLPPDAFSISVGDGGGAVGGLFTRPSADLKGDVYSEDSEDEDHTTHGSPSPTEKRWQSFRLPSVTWRSICSVETLRSPQVHMAAGLAGLYLLLALITAALADGCKDNPPLGRFCIAEGTVQWIVTFAPITLTSCALIWRWHRAYEGRRQAIDAAWRNDGQAHKSAAEVLDALTVAPAAERAKYAKQVVQIMKDFPDKAVIQHKGALAMEAICRAKKGNTSVVKSAGGVAVLLVALEAHLRVRAVQRSGLAAMACLSRVSKSQIFTSGGIPIILGSMTKFQRDGEVQTNGASVIAGLCGGSSTNQKSVAKYGGTQLLAKALERHVEHAQVVTAVTEALLMLASGDATVRKQLVCLTSHIQGVTLKYEDLKAAAEDDARVKDCDAALRSLKKLEQQLSGDRGSSHAGGDGDSDAGSEAGTPRQQDVIKTSSSAASDLQDRMDRWKDRKKAKAAPPKRRV